MTTISFREVTQENWRATLRLAVYPHQQHFIADHVPIAAIALAKAYVRPGGLTWLPYAIDDASVMIGFIELAYEPGSADQYWIYHFFIDRAYQGQGYGKLALQAFFELVKREFPQCRQLRLTVHPENSRAQRLYRNLGFEETGELVAGEMLYVRKML